MDKGKLQILLNIVGTSLRQGKNNIKHINNNSNYTTLFKMERQVLYCFISNMVVCVIDNFKI